MLLRFTPQHLLYNRFTYRNLAVVRTIMTSSYSCSSISSSDDLNLAREIFSQGFEAAIPSNAIRNTIKRENLIVTFQTENITPFSVDLQSFSKRYVVGFGKAVLPMAEELWSLLGNQIDRCVISVPEGTRQPNNSEIEIYTGAENNIPDLNSMQAAEKIAKLVNSCGKEDLLIVLISGGGSALLPLPKSPVTLEEKSQLIKELSRAGASIFELNTVRKRISLVKGGGLVKVCPAKKIISLILSDVLGDPLDFIASGPTVINRDDNLAAKHVLGKYLPDDHIPQSIRQIISEIEEVDVQIFDKVSNIIIGNSQIALRAAAEAALRHNLYTKILTATLSGEAAYVGTKIATLAHQISSLMLNEKLNPGTEKIKDMLQVTLNDLNIDSKILADILSPTLPLPLEGCCLLLGGETTVNVTGSGRGGRNQELALSAAVALRSFSSDNNNGTNITILSAGTDGIDGPCDAAGAVVNYNTLVDAERHGLDFSPYFRNNDSYNFFKAISNGYYHIVTGHTGTNVMDIVVVIIRLSHEQKNN